MEYSGKDISGDADNKSERRERNDGGQGDNGERSKDFARAEGSQRSEIKSEVVTNSKSAVEKKNTIQFDSLVLFSKVRNHD